MAYVRTVPPDSEYISIFLVNKRMCPTWQFITDWKLDIVNRNIYHYYHQVGKIDL